MQNSSNSGTRRGLLLTLFILGLVTVLIVVPSQFRPEAGANAGEGLIERTVSHSNGLAAMWDIREEAKSIPAGTFERFRESVGKNASAVADIRDGFARGEAELKTRLPHANIEYNLDIRIPEIITPDVWKSKIEFLTRASDLKRSDILRNFIKQNNDLVGMTDRQIDSLKTFADYTNPDGNLSFVELNQEINGVPVFRGEVKAGFDRQGQIIRVVNNLAPGLEYSSLSPNFGNPADAVRAAARAINHELTPADATRNDAASTELKVIFGTGDSATMAEKMYFPTEPGVAIPAWRVTLYQPVDAYYVMVDAETGTMLWRKSLVADQLQEATYDVYRNANAFIPAHDSPAPMSPGPVNPTLGTQAPVIPRTSATLIGNEAPFAFNNLGWITDGTNITDGNAVEAGVDRVAPDGVDAPMPGDGPCPGAGCRTFTSTWTPPPAMGGMAPLDPQAQRGAVIQMFWVMNWYHDELYRMGFTEQARNFQNDNFGRGGLANDRVRAEGQDVGGTNNANFTTNADGVRPKMQMYVWTGPTPDYDGTADAEVIIHEVTHGLSNRLHGNNAGLGNQGGMMGEGWSDWYAEAMLSEASDPIDSIYTTGGYATYLLTAGFTANYYYGIRRFPRAPIAFVGPNGKPHNPFTFRYINTGCDTLIGTTTSNPPPNSAYPRGPIGGVNACSQVHNAGEIWSSALWETRALFVTRLGWAAGNRRILQLVTDGMKLAPLNPSMIQERNAIITAAAALPVAPEASADVVDVREGFRRRGMGFSASVQSASAVTEAFDFPNISVVDPFSVSDSTGDNDGFPEPGESVLLSVSITNTTGAPITNVVANVNGGPNVSYGTINDGQTVAMNIPYTVPAAAACGSLHQVTINASSSVGAQAPVIREFRLGAPVGGAPVTFTSAVPVTIGDNAPATPYSTAINVSGLTGNKIMKLELTGVTHTFPADIDFQLVGPGGQKFLGVSDSGGGGDVSNLTISFTDTAAALPSTTQWASGTFRPHNVGTTTDVFPAPAPAAPYLNAAPAGTATFASAFGTDGAALNGTWTLWIRDDAGGNFGTMAGWKLTFESNDFACNIAPRSRADFDGDSKTDLSVFRPGEGNWYLNRSTDGFAVIGWGNSTDTLVPGDYDADGKTDTAVFRPSDSATTPDFYVLNSNGFTVSGIAWGNIGDTPVVADYDGDSRTDVAVFRPSNNTWYVLNSNTGSNYIQPFGLTGDVPMAMDTNADGRAQITMYRPSNNTWYIARPTGTPATNFDAIPFGLAGDRLVPADYDGDSKEDIAVYRPSDGTWYVVRSTGGIGIIPFGSSTDIPVPGDYDGDGSDDIAVYRGGTWYVQRSTSGLLVQPFGLATDTPIPARYIP